MADALESKQPYIVAMPTRQRSTSDNAEVKAQEDEDYKALFEMQLKEYSDEKKLHQHNMEKAYGLILGQCNEGVRNKVMALPDFHSKIKNDPIELLSAIEKLCLHYSDTKYDISVVINALYNVLTVRQKEDESLTDYQKRFETTVGLCVSLNGGILRCPKLAMKMPDWQVASKQNECWDTVWDKMQAYLFMMNADKLKYGSLMKGLASQHSLKNNQYPVTLIGAVETLSEHQWDPAYRESQKKKKGGPQKDKEKDKANDKDKSALKDNELQDIPTLSFAQMEGKCFICGDKDCRTWKCSKRGKIPKHEWAVNKAGNKVVASQFLQTQQDATPTPANAGAPAGMVTVPSSNMSVATAPAQMQGTAPAPPNSALYDFMGLQVATVTRAPTMSLLSAESAVQMLQADPRLKEYLLLDSCSSNTLFCNPAYVNNIHKANATLSLISSGGPSGTDEQAVWPGRGVR